MSRRGVAWLAVTLLVFLTAAVAVVPTVWLKPWSIDHYYNRLVLEFALRRPMLLSELRILEPLGLRFYDDELDDFSPEFRQREADWVERQLELLRSYDRAELGPEARLSYDVLEWFLADVADGRPFILHDLPVNPYSGVQSTLPEFLLRAHRFDDRRGARAYVRRTEAMVTALDQVTAGILLRRDHGLVPPGFVLRLVLREIREFISTEPERHPLYLHLENQLLERDDLDPGEAGRLLARQAAAVGDGVYPAYRRMIAVLEELEPAAGSEVGVWRLPDGAGYYAYALRHHTTTGLTPTMVRRLGRDEVIRIQDEIASILAAEGLGGESIGDTLRSLRTDERFLAANDPEGRRRQLAAYRDIVAEMEARLGEFLLRPPEVAVRIEPVPEDRQATAPAAYYQPPEPEPGATGTFFINLLDMRQIPRFGMRTLTYHEAVPGHHVQGTVAARLADLPLFRRILPFTAYQEGWALYAELLAAEQGFLADPYDRLGFLAAELFRAARLVADTGIHTERWGRDQAIEYLLETTGRPRAEIVVEVERMIVGPGQACAAKIGQLEIVELRRQARERLGERFDLRRFHHEVLRHGALPLGLLERVVERWIAAELGEPVEEAA